MFNTPDPKPDFPKMEEEILAWWKEKNILDKSIDQRPESNSKTFYDGPITANGNPHYGHMLTFAMKDIIPRYWSMKGFKVKRSLGWDCQGLPVEFEVEKNLGFTEKGDIEKYGIEKFNQKCRALVLKFRGDIVELEEKMGRLTNKDEEFATMDPDYIESVWWSLKELHEKGHMYEGFKVVPFSTRAGTSLSNAEVALGGYKPFVDPAITVEFELKDEPNTYILAWTTTPWTIPANLGLAIGEKIKYVKVKSLDANNTYIVAEELVEKVFGDDEHKIVGKIKASELLGKEYIPPFDFFVKRKNVHQIFYGDFVTTESGTGIVHLAPYGIEDNEVFQRENIESFDMLDDQGDFNNLISVYEGLHYRDANSKIKEDLKEKDLLFAEEDYEHDMPMCWRTNTPLIYKPITSWYISMSKLRKELVENNDKINWVPSHFKNGRFGNWLAEIKDWGISRLRYWGTPLPIWKSESGKVRMIGSFEELEELSGVKLKDPHRPFVDDITFKLEGETYMRIPDVLDVWYDSGSMPFARFHYPFENKDLFSKKFPAQYIAEGVDQSRGWFYSLHAIGTALFDGPAFENVVVNGTITDDNGAKLSKSKKNYGPPGELIAKHGADAIRMNFFSSPISAAEDSAITDKTVRLQAQEYMLPLWNTLKYLITYANIHSWSPSKDLLQGELDTSNKMDEWILEILNETVGTLTKHFDSYDFPRTGRGLKEFITNVSKWYIRRSRDRFASGDEAALSTLYFVLIQLSKLSAPITPHVSETIYKTLVSEQFDDQPESVHLTDYPESNGNDSPDLLWSMKFVRMAAELGQSLRTTEGIKVRQPLAKLEVVSGTEFEDWMKDLVKAELNVREVQVVDEISKNSTIKQAKDNKYDLEIGLHTGLTPELKEAGLVREIIRAIQALRKESGFNMGDQVTITYSTEPELQKVIEDNLDEIIESVSATSLQPGSGSNTKKINGTGLSISIG